MIRTIRRAALSAALCCSAGLCTVLDELRRLARRGAAAGQRLRGRAAARATCRSRAASARAASSRARWPSRRPPPACRRRRCSRRSMRLPRRSISSATCATAIASMCATSGPSPSRATRSASAACCGPSSRPRPRARSPSIASAPAKTDAEAFWFANGQGTQAPVIQMPLKTISVSSGFGLRADPFDQPWARTVPMGPVVGPGPVADPGAFPAANWKPKTTQVQPKPRSGGTDPRAGSRARWSIP